MPKLDRGTQLSTRLSPGDLERFRAIAYRKSLTHSELVREALLHYLEHEAAQERCEIADEYRQQLRTSTNRICALLAKTAIGVETLNDFMSCLEESDKLLQECRSRASRRIAASLTEEELAATQAMSKKLAG